MKAKRKVVKIPKDYFKGLKFEIKIDPLITSYPWCPECLKFRDKRIKELLATKPKKS